MRISEGGLSILREMLWRARRCNSSKEINSSRRRGLQRMDDSCSHSTQPARSLSRPRPPEIILVTAAASQGDIASPDPAMKVFATEDLLDANPGRPGAPISTPGYPIETASDRKSTRLNS